MYTQKLRKDSVYYNMVRSYVLETAGICRGR